MKPGVEEYVKKTNVSISPYKLNPALYTILNRSIFLR
jgi:hypothetical protein